MASGAPAVSSSCNLSDSDSDSCEPSPPKAKKHCSSSCLPLPKHSSKSGSEIRRYNERWKSKKLSDSDLEEVVEVWNRKARKIAVS